MMIPPLLSTYSVDMHVFMDYTKMLVSIVTLQDTLNANFDD